MGFSLLLANSAESIFAQIPFWQQTNGPYGGAVLSIAVDPFHNVILAGTYGGIYVSISDGHIWQKTTLPDYYYITSIVTTKKGHAFACSTDRVFRSMDGGNAWTRLLDSLPDYDRFAALTMNARGVLFLVVINDGIFRSTDDGNTWTKQSGSPGIPNINTVFVDSMGRVYLGMGCGPNNYDWGVYYSSDDAVHWSHTSSDNLNCVTCFTMTRNGDILAGTSYSGFYRSTDHGETWSTSNSGWDSSGNVLSLFTKGDGRIFAGANSIYRSEDDGFHWERIELGRGVSKVYGFSPSLALSIIAGTDRGVFDVSLDGNETEQIGIPIASVTAVTVNGNGNVIAGADDIGVFQSSDRGSTWAYTGLNLLAIRSIATGNDRRIFVGGYESGGRIFHSSDLGNSWILSDTALTQDHQVNSIALNSDGTVFAGMGGGGVIKSYDGGDHWIQTGLSNAIVYKVISSTNGSLLACGGNLYRSVDYGSSWSLDTNGIGNAAIQTLTSASDGDLYAGGGSGNVYRSTNDGNSWTRIRIGLTNQLIYSIVVSNMGKVFASTAGDGIFMSTNRGENWIAENSGLSVRVIWSLSIDSNGYLYAGTFGESVYRSTSPVTSIQIGGYEAPLTFSLSQNYPNPFNPATNFQFSIANFQFVSLSVFNVLGEHVAKIVSEQLPPGTYTRQWDASRLASGVYYYSLTAGKFSETRKLLFIK